MKQRCLVLFVCWVGFASAQDSLNYQAAENFKQFFAALKAKFPDDSTTYSMRNFSNLHPDYHYPEELTALAHPENYENRQAYYTAYHVRKMAAETPLDGSLFSKKIQQNYIKLCDLLDNGQQTGHYNEKKENKSIANLQAAILKIDPPLMGYFQVADIEITTPTGKKEVHFLIEYTRNLEVVNFGKP